MNLPANFPLKKVIITVVSVVIVIALIITGVTVAVNGKAANATVDVEQVSNISTQYWGDQSSTYGNATSDFVQELYPDKEKAISKIFVKEGDTVKIGDTLLQYDTTKLQLKVESKELEEKKKKYELEQAEKELTKLQNTAPHVEPVIPEPEPEPTPTPVPESQAELYTEITEHSKPFKGAGTEKDPYVFLCTEDAVLTKGFLLKLLGVTDPRATPTPTPTPTPSAEPTTQPSEVPTAAPQPTVTPEPTAEPTTAPTEAPTPAPPIEPTEAPTPAPIEPTEAPTVSGMAWFKQMTFTKTNETGGESVPTPEPDFTLPDGPFVARFEVHEQDNENLPLVKGWQMDGDKISAGFFNEVISEPDDIQMPDLSNADPGISYDTGGSMYTAEELQQMIADKKQQIQDLKLNVKQAAHDLEKAKLDLENATIKSTVNGVVKSLTDLDTAMSTSSPFLVVSGGDGFYITASLNESLLGKVHVGDTVMASSWENGQMYEAEIVQISDFPNDNSDYYYDGSSNPNSSTYQFTARIADADGLKNGMGLDITLQAASDNASNAIYLFKAYIRSDDGGKYILKVGDDNRVHKTYIKTGKTIYNQYLEIKSDTLTEEDYVAFPYGTSAIDGAKANGMEENTDENDGIDARGLDA